MLTVRFHLGQTTSFGPKGEAWWVKFKSNFAPIRLEKLSPELFSAELIIPGPIGVL